MRVRRAAVACAVALAGTLVACSESDAGLSAPPPTSGFAAVQTIFTGNCAYSGCHAGTNPQQGMDLSAGRAYDNTVGVASRQVPRLLRIEPDHPDSSYIVLKLEGNAGAVGGVGTQMPLGGMLSQAQIETVRAWVASGAPRN